MNPNQARYTSIVRLCFFALGSWLTARYLFFMLNPIHAGHWGFYIYSAIAELFVMSNALYVWLSALHFELLKPYYYRWIADQQEKGQSLINEPVDVMVTVTSEDLDMVKTTFAKCLSMRGHVRVVVLDDGARAEVKALAEEMGVVYLSRPNREFFKSGNLNYGLQHAKAEYMAVFDADFQPDPRFLEHTLPFFLDPRIGIVQTPQVYHNQDTFFARGSRNIQRLFYQYVMPSKFLQHSAFCVGTNVVYRVKALRDIGGFPLINQSEDINTSLRLLEHNPQYLTLYLNKPLASGLAPSTLNSLFNQQYRWALGGFTMLFTHNTLFSSKLRLDQRVQYFLTNWFYTSGLGVMMYLIGTLIALFTQVQPINPAYSGEWFSIYAPMMALNLGALFYQLGPYFFASMSATMYYAIPYAVALTSVIFNRRIHWRPTNSAIKSILSQSLWPFIAYLFLGLGVLALYVQNILPWSTGLLMYTSWGIINWFLVAHLVVRAYQSLLTKRE